MSDWSRGERIALYSLLITAVGVGVGLLTVPEFRRILGLRTEIVTYESHAERARLVTTPAPREPEIRTVTVDARREWTDTGINLVEGSEITIRASGRWTNHNDPPFWHDADGTGDTYPGTVIESANLSSLIGKVGRFNFFVGQNYAGNSPSSGKLYLGMNDVPGHYSDNLGQLTVQISYSSR